MATLRENEANGKALEKIIAQNLQITVNGFKPVIIFPLNSKTFFDFETDFTVYEVKSCHQIIKNGLHKSKKLKSRNGRFWIFKNSHFDIKAYADENKKEICYIFVLLKDNKIIKQKSLSWDDTDKIIAHIKPRSHGDYGVNHSLIFGENV